MALARVLAQILMIETTISVVSSKALLTLFGACDQHLRKIRDALGVSVWAHDGRIHIEGDEPEVACATEVLEQLQAYAHRHGVLSGDDVDCPDPEADTFQCKGLAPRRIVDLNCDSAISNQDFLFLVAIAVDKLGGPGTADLDDDGSLNFCDDDTDGDGVPDPADGCPVDADPLLLDTDGDLVGDACDSDDDGDGDPDATDCAPLSALAANGLPEVCDGLDNNCDGKADEGCPDSVTAGFVAGGLVHGPPAGKSIQVTFGQTAIGAVLTPDASASLGLGACAAAGE